jgi:hypothetical protein
MNTDDIHLVRVTTDDRRYFGGCKPGELPQSSR